MDSEASDILFARRGAAGIVTLNRPAALNAITHAMVRALHRQLDAWAADGAVTRVVVTAAGERAFSAGGDIRALYEFGRAGRQDEALTFFREEYTLNAAIKNYPKPYVALIDGIVMGGGFGVSVHGSHRVAGDRFQFAMPEVGIGFFPDVGATWVLPRMPGETGAWCALTGERIKTADAVAAGIATHHVRSQRFPDLLDALCGNVSVDALLAAFSEPVTAGPVTTRRPAIDALFAADRVEDILGNLDAEAARGAEAAWARATAAAMRGKSPMSLKIARAQVRRGRDWSFEDCMKAEMRIVSRIVHGHDFYEGVRAVIVEKDNAPKWRPAALSDIDAAEVERHFAPIPDELRLP
jgi:enoyl-CoA hydratase/carnithine racemase